MQVIPREFEEDVFVSYNHDNNLLLDESAKGWVDNFHERLEVQLLELIGREPKIWRDPRLSKQVDLAEYLQDRLRKTTALLAILSPGYVNSAWCLGELREFCKWATANGGLHLNGRSRIFGIVKIPADKALPEFARQLTYEFFEIDKTGKPIEFGQELGPNRDKRYWTKLFDVAWEIKELLRESGLLAPPVELDDPFEAVEEPQPKRTIYLAETTDDLKEERRQIKEELVIHGYKVLPHGPSSYAVDSYREAVQENLHNSTLSIHLLGRSYGLIPDGANNSSILRLQVELADEYARQNPAFRRLLWMPEGWQTADEKLSALLQQVKMAADPRIGMEFWQTSLEEFKTLMHKRLSVNGHMATVRPPVPKGPRKVYLVCDRRDVRDAAPLIAYLHADKGYEVILPEFDETDDGTLLTDAHQANLLECDGVLVYYGYASSRWVSAKKADLEKHAGLEKTVEFGEVRPLLAKAFYVTLPQTDLKEVFATHIGTVIKNFGPFDPTHLAGFVEQLDGKGPAGGPGGNDNE